MPKSKKRVSKKRVNTFFRDLGELAFWFATTENCIYLTAQRLLGGPKIGKPVLANLQFDRTLDLIKRLVGELYPKSEHRAAYDAALRELSKCAQLRNELLHSMAHPEFDPGQGKEVLSIVSARARERLVRDLDHASELSKRVRAAASQVISVGLAMGIYGRESNTRSSQP